MVEQLRMDITKTAPEAYKQLLALGRAPESKLDRSLVHLVNLRASQINGCALCIGLHSEQALHGGEKPERLLMLDAWRESSLFSDKERAALDWVEEITLIADKHARKEAFDALRPHFSEEEIAWLTLAAAIINTFNRLAIASRGQYDRVQFQQAMAEARISEPA